MVAELSIPAGATPQQGEYRKIQELASGGMGSVDLARAVSGPRAGQIVAVKRLHPHLEREKHFAEMFFDEARITAGLNHPNVVEIFDWGQDSQGHYLALEFVAGDSLLALIREAKNAKVPIPVGLGLFIVGKVAEGLHAAHELRNEKGELRHLVHRDVTPSNVLLSVDGGVKLIDFGVAKARDRLSHTSTGTIKGKFGYMSPEQARGFPIDRRSDVFSLGIVLWETLALKRLYRSESELEILRMIVDDPPVPIRSVRPEVPASVENLLNAALAKNRDDRIGSCAEFAEFIWAICDEENLHVSEADLAAFFQRVLPERANAVQQLLSGDEEYIEPASMRPPSGSFSGVLQAKNAPPRPAAGGPPPVPPPARASQVAPPPPPAAARASHITPPPAPPPSRASMPPQVVTTGGSVLPITTQPEEPTSESKSRRTPLLVGLGAVGIVGLVGLGWALSGMGRAPSTPSTQAAPSTTTAPQTASAPSARAATTDTAAAANAANTAPALGTTAQNNPEQGRNEPAIGVGSGPSARGTSAGRGGHGGHGGGHGGASSAQAADTTQAATAHANGASSTSSASGASSAAASAGASSGGGSDGARAAAASQGSSGGGAHPSGGATPTLQGGNSGGSGGSGGGLRLVGWH